MLVIIGLIIGGVLVGQSLIEAAAVQATVSQLQRYSTAVNAFYGKYVCLPGDCSNAVSFGLGQTGGPGDNGNGDGIIYTDNLGVGPAEGINFWYHLSQAGMIEGGYVGDAPGFSWSSNWRPLTKAGNSGIFVAGRPGVWPNVWLINGFYCQSGSILYCNVLSPVIARAIDQKMDDGFPSTGQVTASGGVSDNYADGQPPSSGAGGPSSQVCVNNSVTPNAYNVTNNSPGLCSLTLPFNY